MLDHLSIRNYAIIDELEIDLTQGLTIITGETGAGKSIVLGALSLILGQRADHTALLERDSKCIVEGAFQIKQLGLAPFFQAHDLDYDDHTIIRREIAPSGRSRAFINDTPVNLQILRELSSRLVNLHAQHEVLDLFSDRFQLEALDSISDHADLLDQYQAAYTAWHKDHAELQSLELQARESNKDQDYYQFQVKELEAANLKPGEQEELEQQIKLQDHAAEIKQAVMEVTEHLQQSEGSITERLNRATNQMERIASFDPTAADLAARMRSTLIELEDLSSEAAHMNDRVSFDPQQAQADHERLDQIYSLEGKHGVNSVRELLELLADMSQRIQSTDSLDERIAALREQVTARQDQLTPLANQLSANRNAAAPRMADEVNKLLAGVGMENATLQVAVERMDHPGPDGADAIRFLFSSNKGNPFQGLKKVASGGELSRLMLCIKSLIARNAAMPTLIFDEIDTGISGEIADRVGQLIAGLSQGHQVLCITHRPQIASKGMAHYFVYKEVIDDKTHTKVQKLSDDERVREIAKMLSGEQPSDAALANARELLVRS
jgi:DNA repair protein RecN (Recombination protein N)